MVFSERGSFCANLVIYLPVVVSRRDELSKLQAMSVRAGQEHGSEDEF